MYSSAGSTSGNWTPGYALRQSLLKLPYPEVRSIAGPVCKVIELLQGRNLSHDELASLLTEAVDGASMLRDVQVRSRIIKALPQSKRIELFDRLGLDVECGQVASVTSVTLLSASQEQALLSFFGITTDRDFGAGKREPASEELVPRFSLFPHQITVVKRVSSMLARSPRRVVLHLPTGAGKTRCALHVIADHISRQDESRVIWLAYNQEILEQAASEFRVAWSHLGNRPITLKRYWGDRNIDLLGDRDVFVVAGLSKLYSFYRSYRDDFFQFAESVDLAIIDEAHQAIAPTYRQILTYLSSMNPRAALLGLTATPGRTWADVEADRELSDFFYRQKVSLEIAGYRSPVTFLMNEGYLARPEFSTLNVESGINLLEEDVRALSDELDATPALLSKLAESEQWTLRIISHVQTMLTRHRRIIVFATTVDHARLVTAVLKYLGHEAACVTAESSEPERQSAISRFRSNHPSPMVLVNYGVLTAGFDAPQTSAVLIARPTRSLVLYSQMVGRAIRGERAGGNKRCEVVTVVDPRLPGFGDVADAFANWEDVWA